MAAASAPASTFRSGRSGLKCFLERWEAQSFLRNCGNEFYPWPFKLIENYAKANNVPIPPGVENTEEQKFAWRRTRSSAALKVHLLYRLFRAGAGDDRGRRDHDLYCYAHHFRRYVYCGGWQPRSGRTRRHQHQDVDGAGVCADGRTCRIASVVASARLNAATNALGLLSELYVIAAAVIGGTSLAGGVGTIYGAMLGALMMQSIISACHCSICPRPTRTSSSALFSSSRSGLTSCIPAV